MTCAWRAPARKEANSRESSGLDLMGVARGRVDWPSNQPEDTQFFISGCALFWMTIRSTPGVPQADGSCSIVRPDNLRDRKKGACTIEARLRSPQRMSLVAQTGAILKEHIASRSSGERLASERELCHQMGGSRMTLRAALAKLAREGLLRGARGRRRLITGPRKKRGKLSGNRDVVVLSPLPLQGVEPRVLFWIDELREALAKDDFKLDFACRRSCYSKSPSGALEELAGRLQPAVLLLYRSTLTMPQWI